jgi:hypothetical protein
MQLRGLLLAALLLAGLAGGVYYSNHRTKANEGKPAPDAPPDILKIPDDQLTQIEIRKGEELTSIKKADSGNWEITAPQPLNGDQDAVRSVVTTLASLRSDRLIEEKTADLETYGLAKPALEVTVAAKDGKKHKLLIGDETPTSSGYFVKLDGDPRVFTVASYNKSTIDKTWKDLRDKRLLTFDSDKLTRVELEAKGRKVQFGKNSENAWQIVEPKPARADGGQVEELVRKLRDAKMDTSVSDDDARKAVKEFAAAAAVGVAKTTDAAGTQQIEVRKTKDNNYYAKSSVVEGIHKVDTQLGEQLAKQFDDYRNKKLFDFGWSDPNKVEVRAGEKTVSVSKTSDNKWMAGNKQMDSTSVQSLIDKLRDLSATKFADKGYTTPVVEATVVSNDNKRTEKVLISKTGSNYFAVRDKEPSVYELDAKAVEELERAAGDVKEPPPPAKDETKKK